MSGRASALVARRMGIEARMVATAAESEDVLRRAAEGQPLSESDRRELRLLVALLEDLTDARLALSSFRSPSA